MTMEAGNRVRIKSAATTNATIVKATPGKILGIQVGNTGAAIAFLKLYDKATAPTVGTDIPVQTIPIPALTTLNLHMPASVQFTLGIAYAITNVGTDADTTVVVADQITGAMFYV